MIGFETYESENAPPSRRACCTLRVPGNPHMLTFIFGETREEAERKAREWIEAQATKAAKRPAKKKAVDPDAAPAPDSLPDPSESDDETI